MEVGALPARLERGVTAGGHTGRALEGSVGVSGAFGGKCWCGQGFGAEVWVCVGWCSGRNRKLKSLSGFVSSRTLSVIQLLLRS